MAHDAVLNNTPPLHPNFLVATAVLDAYPNGDIILRPQDVDGLTDSFSVFYIGEIVDGIQYFVGLYGEHDVEDMPANPMGMEPLVLGVQLVDSRLTVADTLSVETGTMTIAVANILMIIQYGEALTTDQQSDDPDGDEWTVRLEEYPEPVTCSRVATLEHDGDTYYCYIGDGQNDGVTEYFILIVQVIDDEFFSVDADDEGLWSTLMGGLLNKFGVETDDGSDDADREEDPDPDTSIC